MISWDPFLIHHIYWKAVSNLDKILKWALLTGHKLLNLSIKNEQKKKSQQESEEDHKKFPKVLQSYLSYPSLSELRDIQIP